MPPRASANLPFSDVRVACPDDPSQQCAPDCSAITPDTNSFLIGNTPFGFDFVDDQFPSPWNERVMVALHGAYATWSGARIVAIAYHDDPLWKALARTIGADDVLGPDDDCDTLDRCLGGPFRGQENGPMRRTS